MDPQTKSFVNRNKRLAQTPHHSPVKRNSPKKSLNHQIKSARTPTHHFKTSPRASANGRFWIGSGYPSGHDFRPPPGWDVLMAQHVTKAVLDVQEAQADAAERAAKNNGDPGWAEVMVNRLKKVERKTRAKHAAALTWNAIDDDEREAWLVRARNARLNQPPKGEYSLYFKEDDDFCPIDAWVEASPAWL